MLPVLRTITVQQRPLKNVLPPLNGPVSRLLPNSLQTPTDSIDHSPDSHYSSYINPSLTVFNQGFFHGKLKSPAHISEARLLHSLLLVSGLFNGGLGSLLVNVYVRFSSFDEALLVFHKLPQKSNFAWNAILRGLVDRGWFSGAIEFYYLMVKQGIIPDNFTHPLVLKACSRLSAIEEGKKVHDLILFFEIHHSVKPNVYVECAMIDMFAKCGSLSESRQLFEKIPSKDLASWTAIICGTVHFGVTVEALGLFKRMRNEELQPDSVIIASLLPGCGRLQDKQLGKTFQGFALKSGFGSDLHVSNALIDMYSKCGDTLEARFIFDNIKYKDLISWGSMIACYSQNCQYDKSFDLYLEMMSLGISSNKIIVSCVLPALAKLKLLKHGKEMHGYILKQAFESDVIVGSSLIDMYNGCGSKREASLIFEKMADRDITLWNSMITSHALTGDFDSVFQIFWRIWEYKLSPNSVTLVTILPICTATGNLRQGKEIHSYAIRSSLDTSISLGNSLVDLYCKSGYLDFGLIVFNKMTEKNIVTYNTIISAYGINGDGAKAISFFDQMKEARIKPNKITFVALLSACSHAGLIERGCFYFISMLRDYGLVPTMEHYTCMVDLLGRAGCIDDVLNFIKKMPCSPGLDVLGSLLSACRVHNKVELAELVIRKIHQQNLRDSGYHVLLSNIYASIEKWEDVSKVRRMIKEKDLVKKAGCSWIQVGGCFHQYHSESGMMLPGYTNKIQEVVRSLYLEVKEEGYVSEASLFSYDLVGDECCL